MRKTLVVPCGLIIAPKETFPRTKFQNHLHALGACNEARRWVGRKTIGQAWNTTTERQWMVWMVIVTELPIAGERVGNRRQMRVKIREGMKAYAKASKLPWYPKRRRA